MLVLFRLTLVPMGANLHFHSCFFIKHRCIVVDDAAHFYQVWIVQCCNIFQIIRVFALNMLINRFTKLTMVCCRIEVEDTQWLNLADLRHTLAELVMRSPR